MGGNRKKSQSFSDIFPTEKPPSSSIISSATVSSSTAHEAHSYIGPVLEGWPDPIVQHHGVNLPIGFTGSLLQLCPPKKDAFGSICKLVLDAERRYVCRRYSHLLAATLEAFHNVPLQQTESLELPLAEVIRYILV
jgi:hypothetical protein